MIFFKKIRYSLSHSVFKVSNTDMEYQLSQHLDLKKKIISCILPKITPQSQVGKFTQQWLHSEFTHLYFFNLIRSLYALNSKGLSTKKLKAGIYRSLFWDTAHSIPK